MTVSVIDIPAAGPIHVALSSIELSLLGIAAFDPDALPAIRAGQRINTIDAGDSGTLCHAVPLDGWPEALWRALADLLLGAIEPAATPVDLATLYGPRLISAPPAFVLACPRVLRSRLRIGDEPGGGWLLRPIAS